MGDLFADFDFNNIVEIFKAFIETVKALFAQFLAIFNDKNEEGSGDE
ncbi:MAG: hypothetical protein FWF08_00550 [Oscillospiraceae bacterium]|nr:hypothetical protein [Oscillospiraceae bacterium]